MLLKLLGIVMCQGHLLAATLKLISLIYVLLKAICFLATEIHLLLYSSYYIIKEVLEKGRILSHETSYFINTLYDTVSLLKSDAEFYIHTL